MGGIQKIITNKYHQDIPVKMITTEQLVDEVAKIAVGKIRPGDSIYPNYKIAKQVYSGNIPLGDPFKIDIYTGISDDELFQNIIGKHPKNSNMYGGAEPRELSDNEMGIIYSSTLDIDYTNKHGYVKFPTGGVWTLYKSWVDFQVRM